MERSRVLILLLLTAGLTSLVPPSMAGAVVSGAEINAADIVFETSAPYYHPDVAIVSADIPVRWSNPTASPHSIRHDGCLTDGPCAFRSIAVLPEESFLIAPLPPGRYSYHCELHPIMRGTIIVTESQVRTDRSMVGSMR